jgi:hypothetical protein
MNEKRSYTYVALENSRAMVKKKKLNKELGFGDTHP